MIHTDLPKKIDDSLAKGIVKQLLDEIDRENGAKSGEGMVSLRVGTTSGRKASFALIAKRMKPVTLDIIAHDKTYRSGAMVCAMSTDFASIEGVNSRFLCAAHVDIDLARPALDQMEKGAASIAGHLFAISPHALTRIVQRQRLREAAPLLDILKVGAAWAQMANGRKDITTFMAPSKDGLLCCGMDTRGVNCARVFRAGARSIPIATLRTFVGHDQMRPDARERWQRLVDAGALEDPPRLLRRRGVTDRHREIFEIMVEEGRDWDARRAFSIQRREMSRLARKTTLPVRDEILSEEDSGLRISF